MRTLVIIFLALAGCADQGSGPPIYTGSYPSGESIHRQLQDIDDDLKAIKEQQEEAAQKAEDDEAWKAILAPTKIP